MYVNLQYIFARNFDPKPQPPHAQNKGNMLVLIRAFANPFKQLVKTMFTILESLEIMQTFDVKHHEQEQPLYDKYVISPIISNN